MIFSCFPVMPMDWSTASSRFRVRMPVRTALTKFSTPTRPMMKLSAPPMVMNMLRKPSNSATYVARLS